METDYAKDYADLASVGIIADVMDLRAPESYAERALRCYAGDRQGRMEHLLRACVGRT